MEITKNPFMTANDICDILRIRKNTLHSRRWRKGVQIPVFRSGKYLFIKRTDFWKWFDERIMTDI